MTTSLKCIQPDAAGIDIGGSFHFVAVPQCQRSKKRYTQENSKVGFREGLKALAVGTIATSIVLRKYDLVAIVQPRGF